MERRNTWGQRPLFSLPVFDVALGVALIAATAGPTLSDWRNETR